MENEAETKNPLDSQVGGDHYKKLGDYQPYLVLKHWLTPEEFRGFAKGTAIVYAAREGDKGGDQDLEKMVHTMKLYFECRKEPVRKVSEIQRLLNETSSWSDSVFGCHRLPTMPLYHLLKEVNEVIEHPQDDMEYADCLLLLIDAYRMKGGTADKLVEYAFNKLEINKSRQWGEPDHNGVVEHIRESAE